METVEKLEAAIGGNTILVVLAFIIAVCVIISTVGKAIETLKVWRKPSADRMEQLEEYTRNDKARLDGHEKRLQALEQSMNDAKTRETVMMRGIVALLDHELHNGNAEQMQAASDGINKYLIER